MTARAAGSLGQRFDAVAEHRAGEEAIVCGGERLRFGELAARTSALARALASRGVRRGGRVAIVLPNCPASFTVAIAAWKCGATVIPVSFRTPPPERRAILDVAAPDVIVAEESGAPGSGQVALPELEEAAAAESTAPLPPVPARPWKAVTSGGSTGRPKLIVDRSPGPLDDRAARYFHIRAGGRQLVAAPLYHNGPFRWGVLQLLAGGTVVVMPRFDARGVLDLLARERITWLYLAPTMLRRVLDAALPGEGDALPCLETLLHSAAPCPAWLKRRALAFFGPARVWEYYSSTEGAGSSMVRGDEWLARPGTVGRPDPERPIVVLGDDGEPLPTSEVGELYARMPQPLPFTYWGAEVRRRGDLVSVGDLGRLDADGYLFLSDRRTDLIISGGVNIYPAEVEAALLEHGAVADVAVIGLPHDDWGSQVHAVVEPSDPASPPAPGELDTHVRARLSSVKVPKAYEFVHRLPRDPNGKIRRSQLVTERLPGRDPLR